MGAEFEPCIFNRSVSGYSVSEASGLAGNKVNDGLTGLINIIECVINNRRTPRPDGRNSVLLLCIAFCIGIIQGCSLVCGIDTIGAGTKFTGSGNNGILEVYIVAKSNFILSDIAVITDLPVEGIGSQLAINCCAGLYCREVIAIENSIVRSCTISRIGGPFNNHFYGLISKIIALTVGIGSNHINEIIGKV